MKERPQQAISSDGVVLFGRSLVCLKAGRKALNPPIADYCGSRYVGARQRVHRIKGCCLWKFFEDLTPFVSFCVFISCALPYVLHVNCDMCHLGPAHLLPSNEIPLSPMTKFSKRFFPRCSSVPSIIFVCFTLCFYNVPFIRHFRWDPVG